MYSLFQVDTKLAAQFQLLFKCCDKTKTKCNPGEQRGCCSSGTWRQDLKHRPPRTAQSAFLYSPGPLLRGDLVHNGLLCPNQNQSSIEKWPTDIPTGQSNEGRISQLRFSRLRCLYFVISLQIVNVQ